MLSTEEPVVDVPCGRGLRGDSEAEACCLCIRRDYLMAARVFTALLLYVLALFGPACVSYSSERTIPSHDCAVTVRDGGSWIKAKSPDQSKVLALVDPKAGRGFTIAVKSVASGSQNVTSATYSALERSALSGGGVKEYARKITVLGMPAYEIGTRIRVGDKTAKAQQRIIMTANKMFTLQCTSFSGDPAKDTELMAMRDSFRFLKPQKAAVIAKGNSPYYELGKLEGQLMGFLLKVAGVVAIIVIGVVLLVKKLGAKKAGDSPEGQV